ncbi:MAG: SRPBCC domain-containing protein [Pseudomonadota bacterium]
MNAPVTEMTGQTSLMIKRVFQANIDTLFKALTAPDAIMHWMGAKMAKPAEVAVDLRVGGAYEINMIGHDGSTYNVSGEYLEIDAPTRVSFTWAWQSSPDRVSRVTYVLTPLDSEQTRLTLTHEKLFDETVRDSHAGGWTATFDSLETFLSA